MNGKVLCPRGSREHKGLKISHRLQLSLNLRDSPGFLTIVPRPGRLINCIIGPGRCPDTSINTVVIEQLITYWW